MCEDVQQLQWLYAQKWPCTCMAPKGRVAAATTCLHLHHAASHTWQICIKVGPYERTVHARYGHVH
jgi:hypothetical protein